MRYIIILLIFLSLNCLSQTVYKGFAPQFSGRASDTANGFIMRNSGSGYSGLYLIRQTDTAKFQVNTSGILDLIFADVFKINTTSLVIKNLSAKSYQTVLSISNDTIYTTDLSSIFAPISDTSLWALSGDDIYNKNTGNVGIGKTLPVAKLDIFGNKTTDDLFIVSNDIDGINDSLVTINSEGHVGIGTTNPLYSLDVMTDLLYINAHIGSNNADAGLYLISNSNSSAYLAGGANLLINNWIAKSTQAILIGGYSGNIKMFADTGLTVGNTFTPTNRFTILGSNGNVGIGDDTPDAKLEVTGNILLSTGADRTIKIEDATGNGYAMWIYGGLGANGYNGGDVNIQGGDGTGDTQIGGDVFVWGGDGNNGTDGSVYIGIDESGNKTKAQTYLGTVIEDNVSDSVLVLSSENILSWTSKAGLVGSSGIQLIKHGNGMNFLDITPISAAYRIEMGIPSTLSDRSINDTTEHSHTHEIDTTRIPTFFDTISWLATQSDLTNSNYWTWVDSGTDTLKNNKTGVLYFTTDILTDRQLKREDNTILGRNAGGTTLAHTTMNEGYYNTILGGEAGKGMTTGYENTFAGYKAGYANKTGYYNTAVGKGSLQTDISGYYNTAIGWASLESATSIIYNTAVGAYAGKSLLNGNSNSCLGYMSLYYNKTGTNNVAIGDNAMKGASAYSQTANTAIGSGALFKIGDAGNNNVAVGYNAGLSLVTGDANVFLGYQAGYSETGSNKLYIENSNSATPLLLGYFDLDSLVVNGDLTVTGTITGTLTGYSQVGHSHDQIIEGNSEIDVIDAGTGALSFGVDGVEIARITDGLSIGNTSTASAKLRVYGNKTTNNLAIFDNDADATKDSSVCVNKLGHMVLGGAIANATLQVNGGLILGYIKTSDDEYRCTGDNFFVEYTGSVNNAIMLLPVEVAGQIIVIINNNTDGIGNLLVKDDSGTTTIKTMLKATKAIFICDGISWMTMLPT
jgi:hypothetical protein